MLSLGSGKPTFVPLVEKLPEAAQAPTQRLAIDVDTRKLPSAKTNMESDAFGFSGCRHPNGPWRRKRPRT
jgi:hypothetical protein